MHVLQQVIYNCDFCSKGEHVHSCCVQKATEPALLLLCYDKHGFILLYNFRFHLSVVWNDVEHGRHIQYKIVDI